MTTNPRLTAARDAFADHAAKLATFTTDDLVSMGYGVADALIAARGHGRQLEQKRASLVRCCEAVDAQLAASGVEPVECIDCVIDAATCEHCNGRGFVYVELDTDVTYTRDRDDRLAHVHRTI